MLKKFAAILLTALMVALPLGGLVHAETLGTNLITNPSVDTAVTSPTTPDGWTFDTYDAVAAAGTVDPGTSTVSSVYPVAGHTGNAVQATITDYKDGDVDWAPTAPITITPSTSYRFSDWYTSDVTTEIDIQTNYANSADVPAETNCDATAMACYDELVEAVAPATAWTQITADFTTPAKATSVSVYHLLRSNGTLTTDDYSLGTYAPTPFTKPMISVTFDDGWINQFTNAAPYMQTKGLLGTYYIISGVSGAPMANQDPNYMTSAQVQALYNQGEEIGSHTVHHCDLGNTGAALPTTDCPATISSGQILSEMQDSKTTLQNLLGGTPVVDFAYPYGTYNANTIAVGQSVGYLSQRSVNPGYNTKDNIGDYTQLKMYEVDNDISTAQVEAWMDEAVAQHTWLILCYHEVADAPAGAPADVSDQPYTTPVQNFHDQMDYLANLKAAGSTDVLTVAQARVQAQNEINGTTTPPTTPAPLAVSAPLGTATSQNAATITWLTNAPANSQVRYGLDATYGYTTPLDTQLIPNHSINLTGLAAGTTYHFQVVSTDASNTTAQSADLTFTTLPVGIVGDINNNGRVDDDDATLLFANWGNAPAAGDLNNNGVVNDDDATLLFANWSK